MMEIEIIVQNGRDAVEAEKYGADRLELVSAIGEGGLTPSYGAMKQVFESVSIPVYTMIRPHSNSFIYDDVDFEIIEQDVKQLVELGGKNIVFGALNEDRTVDERLLEKVMNISPDLEITFHRAFDETASVMDAYQTLTKYSEQVKSILTSGGAENCSAGKEALRSLVEESKKSNGPQIMPGAGLNVENIADIHKVVQANQYHFGTAARLQNSFANGIDEQIIKKLHTILK